MKDLFSYLILKKNELSMFEWISTQLLKRIFSMYFIKGFLLLKNYTIFIKNSLNEIKSILSA